MEEPLYIYHHTEEEFENIMFLSDYDLAQAYHKAYDLPFELDCESEMVRRFIDIAESEYYSRLREEEAKTRQIRAFLKKFRFRRQ